MLALTTTAGQDGGTNDEQAISTKLLVVGRSIGNAKRVGQRCVRQTEELRSEYQIDIARCVRPYMSEFGSTPASHV